MNTAIRFRLFIMMVLEFFIWGCWLPLIYNYLPSLGFSAAEPPQFLMSIIPKDLWFLFSQQALILNAFPVAAVVGMFFSNQYADRHFAAVRSDAGDRAASDLAQDDRAVGHRHRPLGKPQTGCHYA